MQIQLPKLKKVDLNRPKKKKIFLLSDDARFASGIAVMSKELVLGTIDKYDWIQLAAALHHPDHGKVVDLGPDIEKELGIENPYCKLFCHTGYGNQEVIREIIMYEKPDAIMIFTDPRFWGHVFAMEDELRTHYKIPIIYNNIWDDLPFPHWNASGYASCDMLLAINKQTKILNQEVLRYNGIQWTDLDLDEEINDRSILTTYIPHGINPKVFYPINEDHPDYTEFKAFELDFKTKNQCDFVIFWNNRNVRRKNPGDVILAFKKFCDQLPKDQAKKCCLFMKTAVVDENGTDLMAVKKAICPEYKVLFNQEMLPAKVMNFCYNLADVTINIASNEGFGLSNAESQMAGTVTIQNVTGGLQDQCRFEDEDGNWLEFDETFTTNHAGTFKKHGDWCFPVFPSNRSLQGSPYTPYIFDDRADFNDVASKLLTVYELSREDRNKRGLAGREWMLSKESGMSSDEMCNRFKLSVEKLFETWKPKPRYELIQVQAKKEITNPGIVWQ